LLHLRLLEAFAPVNQAMFEALITRVMRSE
jgi:hypothetical protein